MDLSLIVVIPVFNESLDVVLMPLLSLSRQTGVSRNDFEILVIVNNSRRQARERSPEFLQNQKIISFFKFLNGEISEPPFLLTDNQRRQVMEIWRSGLTINLVDHSTESYAYERANAGTAKDSGGWIAHQRLASQKGQGIIAICDCDCRFSENFVAEIIESFKFPNVAAVSGPWFTEVDPALDHREILEQAAALHFGKEYSIRHRQPLTEKAPLRFQKRDKIKKSVFVSGPTAIVSTGAWKGVGGMEHTNSFEDIIFKNKLQDLPGEIIYNPNFWVVNLFRVSERAGMASVGRRVGLMVESIEKFLGGQTKEVALPDLQKSRRLFDAVIASVRMGRLTPEELEDQLKSHDVEMDNIDRQDLHKLTETINYEYQNRAFSHGWERTEELVIKKFYRHLPKKVLVA